MLNGATLDTDGLAAAMRQVAPSVSRPKRLPAPVAGVAVAGVEVVARLRGKAPPVCRQALRALTHGHRYDGSKAERELGVRYRPVEETLRRTAAWLVEQGLVPSDVVRS